MENIFEIEEIKEALQKPDKITTFSFDEDIKYYYKYVKSRASSAKYLLAIVKYLNGEGYIITSYFVRHIKWKVQWESIMMSKEIS